MPSASWSEESVTAELLNSLRLPGSAFSWGLFLFVPVHLKRPVADRGAIRLLEEQAELHRRLAARATPGMRQRFSENAVERMKTAELICSLVMGRTTVSELPQDLTFVEKEYLGD